MGSDKVVRGGVAHVVRVPKNGLDSGQDVLGSNPCGRLVTLKTKNPGEVWFFQNIEVLNKV